MKVNVNHDKCRKDSDIIHTMPLSDSVYFNEFGNLHVCLFPGGSIICIQLKATTYRTICIVTNWQAYNLVNSINFPNLSP